MKFDAIIIGGGHSGLEKGKELLSQGKRVLAVCRGESSRRFREEDYDHAAARKEFVEKGGVMFFGDCVTSGDVSGNIVKAVFTQNNGAVRFEADEYWICTGSFFSKGLEATKDCIFEPIFGLDVNYSGNFSNWAVSDFYADQPFMHFGIKTDGSGHPTIKGKPLLNLYASGSIIADE